MLKSITKGKAGRNFASVEHWSDIFRPSEDSLTASVFERLLYLPSRIFGDIIIDAAKIESSQLDFSNGFIEYEFWPSWDAEGTSNSKRVEPDLYVRFDDFDLIVEAKRNDSVHQVVGQWKNELSAYSQKFGMEGKGIVFLAVGGKVDFKLDQVTNDKDIGFAHCAWKSLLYTVKRYMEDLSTCSMSVGYRTPIVNILSDIVEAFGIHHVTVGEWFESYPSVTKGLEICLTEISNPFAKGSN